MGCLVQGTGPLIWSQTLSYDGWNLLFSIFSTWDFYIIMSKCLFGRGCFIHISSGIFLLGVYFHAPLGILPPYYDKHIKRPFGAL